MKEVLSWWLKSKTILAIFEPTTEEALAALHVAKFCRDLGFYEIMLEGGSLSVVKAIWETGQNWLQYEQIVEDTKMVLRSLRQWKICHVKREANGAAHGLAKEASRSIMDIIWIEETPACIPNTVLLELSALFFIELWLLSSFFIYE